MKRLRHLQRNLAALNARACDLTKPPFQTDGRKADSTGPATWSSFDEVLAAYLRGGFDGIGFDGIGFDGIGFDGIGFVVTPNLGIVGVDMDAQRATDGAWSAVVLTQAEALQTYGEISPSGRGVRFFGRGTLPASGRKRGNFEVYNEGRFLTVTGHKLDGAPESVNECSAALLDFHACYITPKTEPHHTIGTASSNGTREARKTPKAPFDLDDEKLVEKAHNAKNNAGFSRLWAGDASGYGNDASAADLALCSHLRFWTRADGGRMDALFRRSGLMREKWDARHRSDGATYGRITIEKALASGGPVYDPTPRATRVPDPGKVASGAADTRPDPEPDGDKLVITTGYPLTDTGNGERFAAQHGQRVFFSGALGWAFWNGAFWESDENQRVFELGKRTVRSIYHEAAQAEDEQRPKIAAWAKASESSSRRTAMIEMAAKDCPSVKAKPDDFDKTPWLFNVANGTLDLQTGKLRPHDRNDRISRMSPVEYDPRADAPQFFQFLQSVLGGDTEESLETAEFLQRFFGYTLTGSTREQCFLILYGDGSNGKSGSNPKRG